MNDRRSSIRNSVRSSDRLFAVWITNTFNIITGSYGGRPPCRPLALASAFFQIRSERLEVHNPPFELIAQITQERPSCLKPFTPAPP